MVKRPRKKTEEGIKEKPQKKKYGKGKKQRRRNEKSIKENEVKKMKGKK